MAKGYCCFTVAETREKICSAEEFANHKLASAWVSRAVTALGIKGDDIQGKPRYPLDDQEAGARIIA